MNSICQSCASSTRGKRCADCFCLRIFRITATMAAKIMSKTNTIKNDLGLDYFLVGSHSTGSD